MYPSRHLLELMLKTHLPSIQFHIQLPYTSDVDRKLMAAEIQRAQSGNAHPVQTAPFDALEVDVLQALASNPSADAAIYQFHGPVRSVQGAHQHYQMAVLLADKIRNRPASHSSFPAVQYWYADCSMPYLGGPGASTEQIESKVRTLLSDVIEGWKANLHRYEGSVIAA